MIAATNRVNGGMELGSGVQFFPVQHIGTFQGLSSTMASTYRESDIAMRDSLDNARFMRTDSSVMECVEARQRAVALLDWSIEPEDEKSPEQKQLCEEMTKIFDRIPRFTEFRRNLLEAIWFGKYGVQVKYGYDYVTGNRRLLIKSEEGGDCPAWLPVHGDKIVFRHDDPGRLQPSHDQYPFQVGIRVGVAFKSDQKILGKYTPERISQSYARGEAVDRGMAYFLDRTDRKLLVIHKHMIEDGAYEDMLSAGSIHGVGIRSRIYWTWVQKQEIQAMLMAYLERTHGGIEIYRYPLGNPEAERAIDRAIHERSPGRGALKVPIPMGEDGMQYGVEIIEPGMAGVQAMTDLLTNLFGHQIKRYILGQTLSTEAEGTGMGSGVADLHLESFLQILKYDAGNLAETITHETLRRLQVANFPSSSGIMLKFKIATEDADQDSRLSAIRNVWEMGARVKESDVFQVVGLSAPGPQDRLLQAPGGGGGGMPPGMGEPPPAEASGGQAAVPEQIGQPDGDGQPTQMEMQSPEKYAYSSREPDLRSAIANAASETDTDPSEAQKITGNYRKGQFHWNGWTISIETPAGSVRSVRNKLGVEWSHTIPVHYGYFRRTESEADGDHVDVFVGPEPESPVVFVIDQSHGKGRFDEHKVMIGFTSEKAARDAYLASYSTGWTGLKAIHGLTIPQFREWMEHGDTGEPISGQVSKYALEWSESEHPRDADGQFAAESGSDAIQSHSEDDIPESERVKIGTVKKASSPMGPIELRVTGANERKVNTTDQGKSYSHTVKEYTVELVRGDEVVESDGQVMSLDDLKESESFKQFDRTVKNARSKGEVVESGQAGAASWRVEKDGTGLFRAIVTHGESSTYDESGLSRKAALKYANKEAVLTHQENQ